MPVSQDEKEYLWEHFKFNADQRIKAFNFFVVFSVFSNGGAFAAFEKNYSPLLTTAIGIFIIVVAAIFFLIDRRSRHLTNLAIPGLKMYEEQIPAELRLFKRDGEEQSKLSRYSIAFNTLYATEVIFGFFVIHFGIIK